nr:UDP-N-acetylglucosamine 2-epimerase [Halomonas gudaonensis]
MFSNQFGIPRCDNIIDIHCGNHGEMTGRMLNEVGHVLLEHKLDRVLVFNTAGALAAAELYIPVDHVEVG